LNAKDMLAQRQGTQVDRVKNTVSQVMSMTSQIQVALPDGLSAERFTRVVVTELRRTPKLAETQWISLAGSIMVAAQLGLEPGPLGLSYLVPYKNECTLIVGYKGMLDLARRSGQISSISAHAVRSGDVFEFEYGLNERLVHRPDFRDDSPPIAFYAVARYKDGGHNMVVLSRKDVESYRDRSPAARAGGGPWSTDPIAMGTKTAIRRLAPFLPLTVATATALSLEDRTVRLDMATGEIFGHDEPPMERPLGTPTAPQSHPLLEPEPIADSADVIISDPEDPT
jgi:recombination protein RecT